MKELEEVIDFKYIKSKENKEPNWITAAKSRDLGSTFFGVGLPECHHGQRMPHRGSIGVLKCPL